RSLLYSVDAVDVASTGWKRHTSNFAEYVCPSDGFVFLFLKPEGSYSATRYLITQIDVECVGP
ncbi:MAG: hypothetical protein AAFO77_11205, partial [Pseudomonadota bacterium]